MSIRTRSRTTALAIALVGLTAPAMVPAAQAHASASVADQPGKVGGSLVLADHASYSGYDEATDGAGNTYIAWITDANPSTASRAVFLCTLPAGSSSCSGGIQHTDALDISGANNLRVLVTPAGLVTLVWYHETQAPLYNGRDGRIAVATSQAGGPLTAAADVADAVSNGELLDAELGPGGALWTVAAKGAGTSSIQVREGVQNPEISLTTPFSPGAAELAFAGTTPVLAMDSDGSITVAPIYARGVGGGFSGWTSVAKTWTAGAHFGLVATKSGVRLVTSIGDASYWPTVSRWTGSGFSTRKPTGDKSNCAPSTHDLGTDTSGRLVDVSNECEKITVDNLPNTSQAGIVRFSAGGTISSGTPQIASTSRGHAVVVWSIEDGGGTGNKLLFARVNLPGLAQTVGKRSAGGTATVTGPTSCQPASSLPVSVHGHAANGWEVSATSLKLGSSSLDSTATLHGGSLTQGKVYTLTGTVTFTKGSKVASATTGFSFRACANP